MGMLAYFVDKYNKANELTPSYILTLFIVSVLALAWAIATLIRRKSRNDSAIFCSFVDLCFVGAFIAGVYELRNITNANCSHFGLDSNFYVSLGPNGFDSNGSPFTSSINKTCAMLKASFAFGIMNTIFFFFTSFLLLFMHRRRRGDRKVAEKRETVYSSRRRSHDSRRGHSRSGSGHHRRSHDSRRYDRPYV
ncbi:MAG: hypothetical protein OHK93_002323 [Ramalina farinacea]|uniref:MARVEL domain-containing protein n=1 Tax=Ramalina farinacea TaxID=258253 RepID=A0AA43U095_9LECA|nr:hypothetical protein [Ramalina farinacea]